MRKYLITVIVMILAVMTALAAITGASAEEGKPAEAVTKITFEQTEVRLFCNDPQQSRYTLQPMIEPVDAVYDELVYASSNEKVVTVDTDGNLSAAGPGKAKITVTAYTGTKRKAVRAAVTVTVVRGVTAIEDEQSEVTTAVKKSVRVSPKVSPEDATNKKLAWKSSDEGIAKVDASGNIRGIQPGNCTVTATAQDGSGTEVQYSVTVIQPVTAIKKDSKAGAVYATVGQNIYEEYMSRLTVMPENATNPELNLTIIRNLLGIKLDVPNNYTLEESSLVFSEPGQYIVTATSTDGSNKSASCLVRVAPEDIRNALQLFSIGIDHGKNGNVLFACSIAYGECGWPIKSIRLCFKVYTPEGGDEDKAYSVLLKQNIQPGKLIRTPIYEIPDSHEALKIGAGIGEIEFDDGTVTTFDDISLSVCDLRKENNEK